MCTYNDNYYYSVCSVSCNENALNQLRLYIMKFYLVYIQSILLNVEHPFALRMTRLGVSSPNVGEVVCRA